MRDAQVDEPQFRAGDVIEVKDVWPDHHTRTPAYVRGHRGTVVEVLHRFPNPEECAYGKDGRPDIWLYTVAFEPEELWGSYRGPSQDTVQMDLYGHWMTRVEQ